MGTRNTSAVAIRRHEYHYLEGVRGLAAFYVLCYHTWQAIAQHPPNTATKVVFGWATLGLAAVAVFIVLSGFLLTLPVTISCNFPHGVGDFLRRRCWRILPPYFVACGLSYAVVVVVAPHLFVKPHTFAHHVWVDDAAQGLLWHTLLIHNLHPSYCWGFNGPLWSVATEFQIYILFGLVLVPLRARFGPIISFALASFLGLVLFNNPYTASGGYPWMVLMFAVGSLAAEIVAGPYQQLLRLPWGWISGLGSVVLICWAYACAWGFDPQGERQLPVCLLAAITTVSFIFAVRRGSASVHRIRPWFESAVARWLGEFSYSLYLVHGLLVVAVESWLQNCGVTGDHRIVLLITLCIPSSIVLARVFYWGVERPTLIYLKKRGSSKGRIPTTRAETSPTIPARATN